MFEVNVEGKDFTWRRHANQLRTRLASLPLTSDTTSTNATEQSPNPPVPITVRRSTRVRKPRKIIMCTNLKKGEVL